ncbi:MAG TPA: flagellar hook capping FlgD N-terminal domain-containing protein [Anaeromyxobacteraceae bacterium]|nr:flagellar hook capping FlgD N-terminal domain-containing protein [Anaeromyxobacteraceae bacterium]
MDLAASRSPAALSSGSAPSTSPRKDLGQDEFLRLLTTQLANQDPLSPMDNQAFIAQLAQFASVEQLHDVGARLDTLLVAQAASNQMSTASLVGKDVRFRTSGVELVAGQPAAIQAELATAADLTVAIRDAGGRTVRTLPLGQRSAGALAVTWDGCDERGTPMPAGRYGVEISGVTADGARTSAELRSGGRVTGVEFTDGAARLLVGGARVQLSDVLSINQG